MEDRINQERNKIQLALLGPTTTTRQHEQLYAAQQALAWAENPAIAKSPYDLIMGIQGDSEGCSVVPRQPPS
jgi:hypothetical protein